MMEDDDGFMRQKHRAGSESEGEGTAIAKGEMVCSKAGMRGEQLVRKREAQHIPSPGDTKLLLKCRKNGHQQHGGFASHSPCIFLHKLAPVSRIVWSTVGAVRSTEPLAAFFRQALAEKVTDTNTRNHPLSASGWNFNYFTGTPSPSFA
ncbi:hypothetical protein AOLI_G00099470 [Acnodon oligacanthus]